MYSMASMFKMNYLDDIENDASSKKDINQCFTSTNKNAFVDFLSSNGYRIKNLSIFPFASQYSPVKQTFIYTGINLISHQTLLSRVEKDLGFHLVVNYKFRPMIKKMNREYYSKLKNNEILIKGLVNEIKHKTRDNEKPRLIYTHLLMPHYPFYFDKDGKPLPLSYELPDEATYKLRYIEYLKYCNKRFLQIIDLIQRNSSRPTIIMFMSDHGLRINNNPKSIKYHFMNINSIYYPSQDYKSFYTGMSNVNQLRVVMNDVFNQKLPILNDSTIFIE
jgi:hypothetical protein